MCTIRTIALSVICLTMAAISLAAQESADSAAAGMIERVSETTDSRDASGTSDTVAKQERDTPGQSASGGTETIGISGDVEISDEPAPRRTSSHRQGLLVVTDDPQCEILINGKSYGQHAKIFVPLPVGRYTVIGRKGDCFDDVETESVESGEVSRESVRARRVHVQVQPPTYVMMKFGKYALSGVGFGVGAWIDRNYIGAFLNNGFGTRVASDSMLDGTRFRKYTDASSVVAGVNFMHAFPINRYMDFGAGLTMGGGELHESYDVSRHATGQTWDYNTGQYKTYEYDEWLDNGLRYSAFALLGPRIAFMGGLERAKVQIAGSYLVRSDTRMEVSNPRNFFCIEGGAVIVF